MVTKKLLHRCAPFTMCENTNEENTYPCNLKEAIDACSYEVQEYLFNQKWAVVQQELPFDEAVAVEVQPDAILDVNEFTKELEQLAADSGVKVTSDGKKVKGRHRKVKEVVAA